MEALQDRREFDFGKLFRWLLSLLVLFTVASVAGLALWPSTKVPVYMDAAGSRQVPVKLAAILRALSYNKAMTLDFDEGELNGFLAERAKVKNLKFFTIDLKPGAFELSASLDWKPSAKQTYLEKVKVPVTLSLRGGFQGGVFFPERAWLGHLPLPGKAARLATDFFASLLPDIISQQRLIDSLRSVAIEERRADLTLAPAGQ